MLKKELIQKITQFVSAQPRTIQEIAQHIDASWVTTDRYVTQIAKEEGNISILTFRGGTRGALKLVYWKNSENLKGSKIQETLLQSIRHGKNKEDFSPFDIYQFVEQNKRSAYTVKINSEKEVVLNHLASDFRKTQESLLLFSGRMAWVDEDVLKIFRELTSKGIGIKILTRVELEQVGKVLSIMAINEQIGKDLIDIRHCEQPLRAFVVDDTLAKFKEQRSDEVAKTFVFYNITDEEWIPWLKNVFWSYFSTAIPARKRVEDINSIQNFS